MHTYEFECNNCSTRMKLEIHEELDYNMECPCGTKMELVFFLKSPDTRAE